MDFEFDKEAGPALSGAMALPPCRADGLPYRPLKPRETAIDLPAPSPERSDREELYRNFDQQAARHFLRDAEALYEADGTIYYLHRSEIWREVSGGSDYSVERASWAELMDAPEPVLDRLAEMGIIEPRPHIYSQQWFEQAFEGHEISEPLQKAVVRVCRMARIAVDPVCVAEAIASELGLQLEFESKRADR